MAVRYRRWNDESKVRLDSQLETDPMRKRDFKMDQASKAFLARIDLVLKRTERPGARYDDAYEVAQECATAAIAISDALYGEKSNHSRHLVASFETIQKKTERQFDVPGRIKSVSIGALRAMRGDVAHGRVASLLRDLAAEMLMDFVALAERALAEGRKDVASVLAAAAFEDAVRRRATEHGMEVTKRDLSDVVNGLKAAGALGGAQAKVVSSYVSFRNRALHGDWIQIREPETAGLIAFLKQLATVGSGKRTKCPRRGKL
ncbi:MAG TPA: hypothetical protein VGJ81_05915 [Thermoanaerobaculia bacterium]|jgi:hypothetical protein